MPFDEFQDWIKFFEMRPMGWREDERTYKLLRAQGVTGSASSLFTSLAVMQKNEDERVKDGEVNTTSLKRSTIFSKMTSAKGGKKITDD